MNAVELLEQQHREVSDLFERIEDVDTDGEKLGLFNRIADALAVHTRIEEEIFYPECKRADVEELLRESLDEHQNVKRLIADLLSVEPSDPRFDDWCRDLKEEVERHVEFEERELLPRAQRFFGTRRLDELGDRMAELAARVEEEGEPRLEIPQQAEVPNPY